jgi:hypothetical protein
MPLLYKEPSKLQKMVADPGESGDKVFGMAIELWED